MMYKHQMCFFDFWCVFRWACCGRKFIFVHSVCVRLVQIVHCRVKYGTVCDTVAERREVADVTPTQSQSLGKLLTPWWLVHTPDADETTVLSGLPTVFTSPTRQLCLVSTQFQWVLSLSYAQCLERAAAGAHNTPSGHLGLSWLISVSPGSSRNVATLVARPVHSLCKTLAIDKLCQCRCDNYCVVQLWNLVDLDDLVDVILQLIKYLKSETYAGLLHVFASCTNWEFKFHSDKPIELALFNRHLCCTWNIYRYICTHAAVKKRSFYCSLHITKTQRWTNAM